MNAKDRMRRARVMLNAAVYRLKHISDTDPFLPMEHVEHVLQLDPNIRVAIREDISEGGLPIEARVKFFKTGHQLLEITEGENEPRVLPHKAMKFQRRDPPRRLTSRGAKP